MPAATDEHYLAARSSCACHVRRADLRVGSLRSEHNAAGCTGKGVPRVERRVVEGEVRAPAVTAGDESCSVEAAVDIDRRSIWSLECVGTKAAARNASRAECAKLAGVCAVCGRDTR